MLLLLFIALISISVTAADSGEIIVTYIGIAWLDKGERPQS